MYFGHASEYKMNPLQTVSLQNLRSQNCASRQTRSPTARATNWTHSAPFSPGGFTADTQEHAMCHHGTKSWPAHVPLSAPSSTSCPVILSIPSHQSARDLVRCQLKATYRTVCGAIWSNLGRKKKLRLKDGHQQSSPRRLQKGQARPSEMGSTDIGHLSNMSKFIHAHQQLPVKLSDSFRLPPSNAVGMLHPPCLIGPHAYSPVCSKRTGH